MARRRPVWPPLPLIVLALQLVGTAGCDDGPVDPDQPGRYQVIDLGTLGGDHSWAADLNDQGVVVGRSHAVDGRAHPFRWEDGTMIDLAGTSGEAEAINNRGDIVGSVGLTAAVWRDGELIDLGMLPGHRYSTAVDINDDGHIIGYSAYIAPDARDPGAMHALYWDGVQRVDLGSDLWLFALNDHGAAAGCYQRWADQVFWCTTGIVRRNGVVTELGIPPLDQWVQGVDIDEDGLVLARRASTGSFFLWRDGEATEHRYPDRPCTIPAGLGPDGTVVGHTCGFVVGHAFLWRDGEWTDLSALTRDQLGDSAAVETRAVAINRHGQIVGYRLAEDGQQRAILWDPVK